MNRATIAAVGFALVAGYFLWTEHSAHVVQALPYLPWLLLLACPLLHIVMHGGHGGGHDHEHNHKHNMRQDTSKPNTPDVRQSSRQQQDGGRHE